MELDRKNIRKIRGLIVFTILLLIGLYRFEMILNAIGFILDILFPLFLGCAIAFILSVPMEHIRKLLFGKALAQTTEKKVQPLKKLANSVSLLLSILLVLALLYFVMAMVLPQLTATVTDLTQSLPKKIPLLVEQLKGFLAAYPNTLSWLENIQIDWQQLIKDMADFFKSGATSFFGSTLGIAKGILSAFATFLIGFVFACYILLQKEALGRQSRKLLFAFLSEKHAEQIVEICGLTHKIFANFLTGQCLEAVILGTMFFLSMTIFRFPYALLVGVLIAFTALIPIFGAFVGCLIGTFLILTVNPTQALTFIILFLILQQIEGNLIYPRVVGGSVGLPSIWVLAAVTVGGSLFGIIGMLVFIPIVSVIYTLLRETTNYRLKEKHLNVE
ncbi:pheromone autoinducer 2 transporter [Anaerotignum neopropionicum]|uniref:Pheromone autoinducer 2 transporter n=1 Tax=Anaerotignum neopropionicum TaxID=36847 RepID=A0A136WHS6_9FIRM|nr:AI-2E family transporter [Anaerotignum neopropionicum]KXL54004.1 pheromone autoinducer 2 transporter [Anaerotignum neopropionicum]